MYFVVSPMMTLPFWKTLIWEIRKMCFMVANMVILEDPYVRNQKIMFPYGQHLNFVEVAFSQKFMIFCILRCRQWPTMGVVVLKWAVLHEFLKG